jgi:hypothetical protein
VSEFGYLDQASRKIGPESPQPPGLSATDRHLSATMAIQYCWNVTGHLPEVADTCPVVVPDAVNVSTTVD